MSNEQYDGKDPLDNFREFVAERRKNTTLNGIYNLAEAVFGFPASPREAEAVARRVYHEGVLSVIQEEIVSRHYGINDELVSEKSDRKVGEEMGISKNGVRNSRIRAIKKIRKSLWTEIRDAG